MKDEDRDSLKLEEDDEEALHSNLDQFSHLSKREKVQKMKQLLHSRKRKSFKANLIIEEEEIEGCCSSNERKKPHIKKKSYQD